jgi:two-component system sensor histidine kinase CpxA
MGRLFWRIFLSFTAAMVIILVIAVTVTFQLAEDIRRSDPLGGRAAAVQAAARALETGGREGLVNWLRRNPRLDPRVELLIIDDSGADLLGRPLPRRMRFQMRGGPRREGPPPPRNYRPSRFAPQLIGPDGTTFRLITAPAGPSMFGVLAWPRARLIWLMTAVLITGLVSWLLTRYLTAPIGQLQTASRSLAAGRLRTRIGPQLAQRRDALGDLARDFDQMAAQLEQLITQREILLRDVSHELRSPLTRLRMALALAQRRDTGAAAVELERIELEADRLGKLIDQVLDLASSDGDDTTTRQQPVDLVTLLDGVVADARFEQPDRDIQWPGAATCAVSADAAALTSAIENVVRNALTHSPGDQPVELSMACPDDGWVELCVGDRGPGVPDSDLERIFEPFFQVEPSRGHDTPGFGIGLAISARIVRAHGGRIVAHNRPDGGLRVCLKLPAVAA